jgi:hypothetical protein
MGKRTGLSSFQTHVMVVTVATDGSKTYTRQERTAEEVIRLPGKAV